MIIINITNFNNYSTEKYISDIRSNGMSVVWDKILEHIFASGEAPFLSVENFGRLYEIGLAEEDKNKKKACGQYFTPEDVATVMAKWLLKLNGDSICDIACGTGNLILAYLKQIRVVDPLLKDKKIYLYDSDATALKIAQYSIAIKYGKEYCENINVIHGDFLDKKITLPKNAKVITNPPFAKISEIKPSWEQTKNILSSKDLYSAFIEKIANSGNPAVIISPYSFLGGSKFYPLRQILNNHNGFIVSFDNIPGNIFHGKKIGIFNSNTSNAVRASITVIENNSNSEKGFRTSHLIRFKTNERTKILDNDFLTNLVSQKSQIVSQENPMFAKVHKELEPIFDLLNKSKTKLSNLLSPTKTEYVLYIPNTCRYFTTASATKLNRTGLMTLYAKDEESYNYLYCLINSSFAYWWWRIYDGGITYTQSLLKSMSVFYSLLTDNDKLFMKNTCEEMIAIEKGYIATKLNAGVVQENVKFPVEYRKKINEKIFKILGAKENCELMELVHNNMMFAKVL